MIVHVIKPSGVRFEANFGDNTPDARILADLRGARHIFGRQRQVQRPDPGLGGTVSVDDETAPFAFDDDATIVEVGRLHGDTFIPVRRIKGPAPEPATPPAAEIPKE